jgi:uncharacterized protein (DUF697 family)
MKEIALELVESEASTVGHKVGWNPIPKADQVPIQDALGSLIRGISERFAFEPSEEFVQRYITSYVERSRSRASWAKVVPAIGTLFGGICTGVKAREVAKDMGRAYVDALVECRTRDGVVTESGLKQGLAACRK